MNSTNAARVRTAGRLLTALALLAIGVLTLQPRPELAPLAAETPLWCLVCGSHGLVDVALNVLLFLPLGIGLGLAGVRPRTALLVAAATTLTIELLQMQVIAGRDASLSDLITNTTGAGMGLLLARHRREILFPAPAAAARFAGAWSLLVLGVAGLTGAAVAPSMPGPPYWGQWTPELGGLLQHHGDVESAHVEDIATPGRRVPASAALSDSLADGELSAIVTATLAGRPPRTAPIFRLVDGFGRQALLVAQDGRDLIVETGTRAERLRLRTLTVRLQGAMPAQERVRIAVASDRRGYTVAVHGIGGPARTMTLQRSVAWGWALLVPYVNRLDERRALFDAVWMGLLLLPVGWWTRSRGVAVGAVAVLVAALAAVPLGLGLAIAGPAAWAGGVAGLALGAGCAHAARAGRPVRTAPARGVRTSSAGSG